jgi:hypothetical protein
VPATAREDSDKIGRHSVATTRHIRIAHVLHTYTYVHIRSVAENIPPRQQASFLELFRQLPKSLRPLAASVDHHVFVQEPRRQVVARLPAQQRGAAVR